MTKDELIEKVARRLSAQVMGLANAGEKLPDELWTQMLPRARFIVSMLPVEMVNLTHQVEEGPVQAWTTN